ncbi:MAG: EAL domain-containing protein [Rhodocyclaceae bacterium]|nr:EAL domain-containing protein [Rhodocyclaceae bacterium]
MRRNNRPITQRTTDQLSVIASVFEYIEDAVIITDAKERIIDVNRAFSKITGYSREEVLGKSFRLMVFYQQEVSFSEAIWNEIHATGCWCGEVVNCHKNGEIYTEALSLIETHDETGAVIQYIGIFSDITQKKMQEAQAQNLMNFDVLTGLPNRTLFVDRMNVALTRARRSGENVAIGYLDLDDFKSINDTYGPTVGDKVLLEVAKRLHQAIRSEDAATRINNHECDAGEATARMGGDEFAILLTNLADLQQCDIAMSRILKSIDSPMVIDSNTLQVTASIGVTIFPEDGADANALLRHADQALYLAKETGRNRYHLFDHHRHSISRERRALLTQMEAALVNGEFCLYYQPKVDMMQGTVRSAEALIRWRHPERGLISPGEFIPVLEGSHLEIPVGEWVIKTALAQMEVWRKADLDLSVSVNIAPPHLAHRQFSERLKFLLDQYPDTPKNRLELEILEGVALGSIEQIVCLIEACRSLHVNFALDDFGTGYSSLTYLKRLPVDLVKIDQSFVRDMLGEPRELALVEGVIGMSKAFHIAVLAEGVETEEQGITLIRLGCVLGQGYGIARPMPAKDMLAWVASWQPSVAWKKALDEWTRDAVVLF